MSNIWNKRIEYHKRKNNKWSTWSYELNQIYGTRLMTRPLKVVVGDKTIFMDSNILIGVYKEYITLENHQYRVFGKYKSFTTDKIVMEVF